MSQQTAAALGNLLTLFGTFTLVQDLGDYLEDGFLSGSQAAALRTMQYMVGLSLRPVPALLRCVMPLGGAACLQSPQVAGDAAADACLLAAHAQ